jgi:hypothetical protein
MLKFLLYGSLYLPPLPLFGACSVFTPLDNYNYACGVRTCAVWIMNEEPGLCALVSNVLAGVK